MFNTRSWSKKFRNNSSKVSNLSEKDVGSTDSILSVFYVKILNDLGLNNLMQWSRLMNSYLADPLQGIKKTNKDQSYARSNLQKELTKPKMTWKVFCKGLRFINITDMELVCRFKHAGRPDVTEHVMKINLGSVPYDEMMTEPLNVPVVVNQEVTENYLDIDGNRTSKITGIYPPPMFDQPLTIDQEKWLNDQHEDTDEKIGNIKGMQN